jgi:hypothetical protein
MVDTDMWFRCSVLEINRFQVSGVRCQQINDLVQKLIILNIIRFVFLTPDT